MEQSPTLRLFVRSHFFTQDNPVSEEIYRVLEEMDFETGGEVAQYLNSISSNLTVCPKCGIYDFTHAEGCEFNKRWNPED